jgi:hypothetical protein
MPEKSALEYVSNAMHSIKVDLKSNLNYFVPRLSQTKRDRLKIIVEEWGKLGLATGEPSRFNAGELPDLKDALIDCRLGLLPTGPAKGNG